MNFTKFNQNSKLEDYAAYLKIVHSDHELNVKPKQEIVVTKAPESKAIRTNRKFYLKIAHALRMHGINTEFSTAKTGNVLLLVKTDITYSVCRFASTGKFKIFYPFMKMSDCQTKVDAPTWKDVIYFFLKN
jgi:hypothetical protein